MSDLPPEGSVDRPYREAPYVELIREVHWPSIIQPTSLMVGWTAQLVDAPGGHPWPYYESGYAVMDVSVGGLPELSRSSLKVGTIFVGDPPIPQTIWQDFIEGGFPDGELGFIYAAYSMGLGPVPVGGQVRYATTARGADRFGGARAVTISLGITLFEVQGGTGYTWRAYASGVGDQDLAGTAGSGGTLTLNATLNLYPPSLAFGSG